MVNNFVLPELLTWLTGPHTQFVMRIKLAVYSTQYSSLYTLHPLDSLSVESVMLLSELHAGPQSLNDEEEYLLSLDKGQRN